MPNRDGAAQSGDEPPFETDMRHDLWRRGREAFENAAVLGFEDKYLKIWGSNGGRDRD
jgi:hypothetical protein